MKLSTKFLSYSTNHLILQGVSWEFSALGLRICGKLSFLAGPPVFDHMHAQGERSHPLSLTWKREADYSLTGAAIFFPHVGCSPFPHVVKDERSIFPPRFWCVVFFLHDWGLLDFFLTHHSSTLGISQAVWSFRGVALMFLVCYVFSLTSKVVFFNFPTLGIQFCNDQWVGYLHHHLAPVPRCFPRWKSFWKWQVSGRRDPQLLGCC